MRLNKRTLLVIILIIICLFVLLFINRFWLKLKSIIKIIFYAIIMSYVLEPIVQLIEKKLNRTGAIAAVFLILLFVIALFSILLVPMLIREITSLLHHMPTFTSKMEKLAAQVQQKINNIGLSFAIQKTIQQNLDNFQQYLAKLVGNAVKKFIEILTHIPDLFMVPVLSFYFLKDREYFKKIVVNAIPRIIRKNILQLFYEMHLVLQQFIRVQLLIALIIGIFSTIGFIIIGLPYALVLGSICGIFEIIPYFGPFLGAIPALIISAVNFPSKIIWTITVVIIVQQLEGNVITPKIMGDKVQLHPIYVILSLWIGGVLFGIWGMFFSIPAVLVIRIIFKNVYLSIVSIR